MDPQVNLSLENAERLCVRALIASKTSEASASSTAQALIRAQTDGQKGHGLSRIPSYCAQSRVGKVNGFAVPEIQQVTPALIRVDAGLGFAYPAIDLAISHLSRLTPESGIAMASIFRSHHFGQAGAHAERLADLGLIALVFGNSPKAIAFWGGKKPMMGTNPIAFAAPTSEASPIVIDLALAKAARGKILAANQAGEEIPDTWALDAKGNPTTDPTAALKGSMLPIGDAKGAALVLMVEILAAAVTGSSFGYEASSFFDDQGGPPNMGHTIIAMEPSLVSGGAFTERLANIVSTIEATTGARLPGLTRLKHRERSHRDGVHIPSKLFHDINGIIERP